jgi:DNA-nicking Smr family endonuclease
MGVRGASDGLVLQEEGMKRYTSLQEISALKIETKVKAGKPPRQGPPVPEEPAQDCGTLFHQAVAGVEPLKGAGRQIPPEAKDPHPCRIPAAEPDDRVLRDLVDGKIEFAFDQTDEFLQAHVLGMDGRIFRKLKSGMFSVEAHLDLHGQNAEQACCALIEFIRASYMAEKRCLLVVTGRGRNSPDGYPVIKQQVQEWLTKDPLKRVVLAFCTALQRDGGAGAMYVLLRRSKKSRGKVIWSRMPLDTE